MSPALIALLSPILQGLLSLIGATKVEGWLIEHALTFVAGYVQRYVKLDPSWTLSLAVSDAASGTVTATITRSGRTAIVLVFEPLGMTAAHQATIAAVLGALFHQGEEQLLSVFKQSKPAAS